MILRFELDINCKIASGTGLDIQSAPLKETGSRSLTITFKGCVLEGALGKKCKMPAEKATEQLEGKLISETELQVKPAAGGKSFIKFSFEQREKCPATILGEHEVTGQQILIVEKPGIAEETKKDKSVVKSGLKLIEDAAELEGGFEISFIGLGDLVDVALA